jgi:hypothetical protein
MGDVKWRRDNPELARAAADKDQAQIIAELKRMEPNSEVVTFGDEGDETSKITPHTAVYLTIGTRGDLTARGECGGKLIPSNPGAECTRHDLLMPRRTRR